MQGIENTESRAYSHSPAEIPEREARDGAPVHNQQPQAAQRHPPRSAVCLEVALALERLHLRQLFLDQLEAAAQEACAVGEGRHLDRYARPDRALVPARVLRADADRELGGTRGVADEVADVRGLVPLERAPARAGAAEGNDGRCGRERREDQAGYVG